MSRTLVDRAGAEGGNWSPSQQSKASQLTELPDDTDILRTKSLGSDFVPSTSQAEGIGAAVAQVLRHKTAKFRRFLCNTHVGRAKMLAVCSHIDSPPGWQVRLGQEHCDAPDIGQTSAIRETANRYDGDLVVTRVVAAPKAEVDRALAGEKKHRKKRKR